MVCSKWNLVLNEIKGQVVTDPFPNYRHLSNKCGTSQMPYLTHPFTEQTVLVLLFWIRLMTLLNRRFLVKFGVWKQWLWLELSGQQKKESFETFMNYFLSITFCDLSLIYLSLLSESLHTSKDSSWAGVEYQVPGSAVATFCTFIIIIIINYYVWVPSRFSSSPTIQSEWMK